MTHQAFFAAAVIVVLALSIASHPADGQVRINEFVAKNDSGIQDPQSEYEDWIELLNAGSTAVDISGWYLSDKPEYLTKWTFPAGTTLQPGATLLIWADEDGKDGIYHAGFKLAAAGESILLTAKDGKTVMDRVDFGPQQADVATGRMEALPSVWVTFPVPTPRTRNQALPSGHLSYRDRSGVAPAVRFAGTGTPRIGGKASYLLTGAPASTPGYFAISAAPGYIVLSGLGVLLVSPVGVGVFGLKTDVLGAASVDLAIPNLSVLVGKSVVLQSYVQGATAGGLSGGVVTTIGS